MRDIGVDIRVVGILTLAQAPWAFKVLWSPLMDRYVPPFWGRRRGWMAISQVALVACGLMLAGVGSHPDAIWVVGAIALAIAMASASQDIAYDAYTVDVLRPEEQGAAAGARTAAYRAAMAVSGGAAITAAAQWGWPFVNLLLAALYLPMLVLTWKAPEPEYVRPPATLRDAVWHPFLELLSRPRALEILAFVVLYKFADQLAQALTRPFLIDMGYNAYHRGVALATVGLLGTVGGALLGGWITTIVGLGRSLWIFGVLQIFSNLGYFVLARATGPNVPLMYGATSFELFTSGLGTGAFSVLLLRLTKKRFSATQYALFSSLFALPRLAAGPVTGFAVHAIGWPAFYLATMVIGVPGLVMLARFVPPGVRDPQFAINDIDDIDETRAERHDASHQPRGARPRRRRRVRRVRARHRGCAGGAAELEQHTGTRNGYARRVRCDRTASIRHGLDSARRHRRRGGDWRLVRCGYGCLSGPPPGATMRRFDRRLSRRIRRQERSNSVAEPAVQEMCRWLIQREACVVHERDSPSGFRRLAVRKLQSNDDAVVRKDESADRIVGPHLFPLRDRRDQQRTCCTRPSRLAIGTALSRHGQDGVLHCGDDLRHADAGVTLDGTRLNEGLHHVNRARLGQRGRRAARAVVAVGFRRQRRSRSPLPTRPATSPLRGACD